MRWHSSQAGNPLMWIHKHIFSPTMSADNLQTLRIGRVTGDKKMPLKSSISQAESRQITRWTRALSIILCPDTQSVTPCLIFPPFALVCLLTTSLPTMKKTAFTLIQLNQEGLGNVRVLSNISFRTATRAFRKTAKLKFTAVPAVFPSVCRSTLCA